MRLGVLLVAGACSYSPPSSSTLQDATDGPAGDGPSVTERRLVLSEIFVEGGTEEHIEIFNPGTRAVSLADVYLTDVAEYWALPGGVPLAQTSDFIAKFPAGTTIGAGELVVIAVDGPQFVARHALTPAYTLRTVVPGAAAMTLMTPPPVSGALSDDGELLVMFQWDGQRDLVSDLDIVVHGMPSMANVLNAKQPVDGPDADNTPTAYAIDANLGMQMTMRTGDGSDDSYQRRTLDEQETSGGNGLTGDDETTEPLDSTWSTNTLANPGVGSF